MESRIGVGIIIGLVFVTTTFIWKSDNYTKNQKIFLTIFVLFPPAQWLFAILIYLYNYYEHHNKNYIPSKNSNAKFDKNISVQDKIDSLKNLRANEILTETEFKDKLKLVNDDLVTHNTVNSAEYQNLKKLFNSGLLTEEELNNKIKILQSKFGNSIDSDYEVDDSITERSDKFILKTRHIVGMLLIGYIIFVALGAIFGLFG